MPLVIISFPMCHAESFRSILQYPKRHCIRTPITAWPKQRNYLLDTGEEAHLCYNGPQKYIYYQKSPYEIFDRGSQARDRVFIIVLCQQLPSLIPVYHPFLDLPHMQIHAIKEPIYRRNHGSPSTAKIERLVYYGGPDGNGDRRETFGRAKHM